MDGYYTMINRSAVAKEEEIDSIVKRLRFRNSHDEFSKTGRPQYLATTLRGT